MEQNDISLTCNSLTDVVDWSTRGYVIVLNEGCFYKCYCRPEYFSSDKMVQIYFSNECKSLIQEELPCHLLDNGCIRMTRDDFLKLNISDTKVFSL